MPTSTETSNHLDAPGHDDEDLDGALLELEVTAPDGTCTCVLCQALA